MQSAAVLREILDAQLEMVCRFRADGTILYANRAYAASLGELPEALAGRNLWQFIVGEDRASVQEQLDQLSPENVELTIENRFETNDGPRWTLWRNHALEFDGEGRLAVAQSTGIDITERRLLEERTALLIDELNHRVKNTLMVVQAMAQQTFRGAALPAEPVVKFNERLSALAGAHTTLSRASWAGASLEEIIRQGTAICGGAVLHLSGPEVMVTAEPTVPLIMVMHELSTNAMKYGALSGSEGRVDVSWTVDPASGWIAIEWRERGGPRVAAPQRKGFGSRMIEGAVSRQLSGRAEVVYDPAGLVCRIAFPGAVAA
ncbi:PAS domain S-box protein [Novosphingobium sp. KCTC 2891]|uniref:sensor histidine kinase n=1 Tax=Novosphingobium sp. KCTC 2891 TaxID=2989730 RepID=UPI00222253B7|nr:HWE histidine kinase domain-containing protein [Novosphingobium sp. KCTC 2891]MCW1382813.1 PAS domain S-box protein [Novosphingobium sp. KCTC 2891]